jgi:hypothetical protein
LHMAERPQQFLYRLHRDSEGTVQKLVASYMSPPIVQSEGSCSV